MKAWLIERDISDNPKSTKIVYLTANNIGLFDWSNDPHKAIRFCRKDDADMVAGVIGDDAHYIRDHIFYEKKQVEKG